jgi:homeobox protein cut-like
LTFDALFQYAEDIESGSSDVEAKYKKMYEDDINPFAAFSKKVHMRFNISLTILVCILLHIVYLYFLFRTQEKDQRYKELGLRDKITLSSGRFLLGNKYDALPPSRRTQSLPFVFVFILYADVPLGDCGDG